MNRLAIAHILEGYYKTLQVRTSASTEEIKAAYRKLARRYHPDLNPGNHEAEARFKEINAAYAAIVRR